MENSENNIKSTVYINGSKSLEITQNIKVLPGNTVDMKVSDFGNLVLGIYNPDAFPLVTSEIRVAHMQVGAFNYTDSDITNIYNLALPYFNGTIIRKQRSGVLYHDHQAYDGLDVVTLKGTLVSSKGVHPSSIGYQAGTYKLDKTRQFEYDDSRKTHLYGSYGDDKDLIPSKAKLVYDFNMKNTGMLSIRFKPTSVGPQLRTILSLHRSSLIPFALYVNSSNKLVYLNEENGTLNNTILPNTWNQLVIRWDETLLRIHLNGDPVVEKPMHFSFENALVSVGALISGGEPSKHFNGQFEMLAYSDQIYDNSKVSSILNSFQTIAYESEYDLLGRKEKDELSIGSTKRTAEYMYNRLINDPAKIFFEVEHMKTFANQDIYYNYDALGNVIEMITPEGTYEYKYDFMGRLIEEYNPALIQTIKMEYTNQNLIKKTFYDDKTTTVVKQMEFLTNSEDQLVYVGTVENGNETPLDITYDPKYVGNPLSIGTKQLTWEGRRLKQIIDGTNTFTYTYNEQGLRTKKNIKGVETKYYLQGSNIVAEKKNGQTIQYIYNEQNQLVGFEHQQNNYFYVRDLLGIIRNIIDVNGNIVVTYKYDGWGNHKVYGSSNVENTSTDFIGNINPFRYKGYYYDVETEWYYLESRYYSPLLSRFINMDHTQYLEPGTIDSVNLFAYCGNNPVMYSDPSGNFAISLLVAGFIIGAIVGSTASVVSQGITNGWDNINGWQVALDGTIGGISGLLAFTGIGALGSAFISGGLGFIGSVGGDLIASNGDWNQVNWVKAGVMTAVNFGLGLGAGAQNSKAIGKNLWKTVSKTKVGGTFQSSAAKFSAGQMSQRGFQGVMNLYGSTLAASMTNAMPMVMANRITSSFVGIGVSGGVDVFMGWLFSL
ncbi:hypothetical protein N7603_06080 [Acholeplasma vituli]|uniref:RHS repeat-associated core domain protein n=2 Tax=Paracholeplasma vituli TaxID=69473 RepID=A0ABT2PW81_9MOLU|nr:hypothetical protein [Paracholeplasma vituli]